MKHFDKIIYVIVIVLCCYFGYQTKVTSVKTQEKYIEEFEKNLTVTKEGGKSFSLALQPVGVLYVPDINLSLAVFNNSSESAISNGAGLIQGTGTLKNEKDNSVITAHNGDPSKDLFINLTKLKVGNKFYMKLKDGKTYEYEVFDTREVSPVEEYKQFLKPENGDTYVTLRTCTPIGINDKRFLATGKLIGEASIVPQGKGMMISLFEWGLIVIALGSGILLVLSIRNDIKKKKKGVVADAKADSS